MINALSPLNPLSRSERRFIDDLLAWDSSRRSLDWLLCNIALVVAGIIIVGTAVFAVRHLNDEVVFGVVVPGFVLGLFFVGVHVVLCSRIRERHRLAGILRKVSAAARTGAPGERR